MAVTATRPSRLAKTARWAGTAWDLLVAITLRDLRVRYQGTLLSYVWWIARPLAMGAVLYFALGQVLRLDIPNYSLFLLSALFPWFWFSGSVQQSADTFLANEGLIKKVQFPRIILPLSAVFYNTIQFLLTLPILTVFVLIAGLHPDVTWLASIPILVILQVLLLVGLGTLLATLNVFFRDVGPVLDVALLLGFYVSPIIYSLDNVPDNFKPILLLNPIVPLLEGWRDVFLRSEMPGPELWPAIVLSLGALVTGVFLFTRLERHFADAL